MQLQDGVLDKISVEEMRIEILGVPDMTRILLRCGEPSPFSPKFSYSSLDWTTMARFVSDRIAIVDFGEAYLTTNHKKKHFGIPGDYGAPEILLGGVDKGAGTDIYALGQTLMDFRTRDSFIWSDATYQKFINFEMNMGPCPPPYRELAQERFGSVDKESAGDSAEMNETSEDTTSVQKYVRYNPESKFNSWTIEVNLERSGLSPEEVVSFSDLLHKLFQWQPEDRWTTDRILTHRWFSEEHKPAKDALRHAESSYAGLISPVQTSSSSDTLEDTEEPVEAKNESDGNNSSIEEEGKGPDTALEPEVSQTIDLDSHGNLGTSYQARMWSWLQWSTLFFYLAGVLSVIVYFAAHALAIHPDFHESMQVSSGLESVAPLRTVVQHVIVILVLQ
ncbi:hypothetical protein PG993_013427 [Apiospora rasikravindrae]|uniref:Protein kinase domain-containing protein n=1 Tax=Apiospora rasikravindrae TaxID=990691 RepID=A0ABR1RXL6_9PEZI